MAAQPETGCVSGGALLRRWRLATRGALCHWVVSGVRSDRSGSAVIGAPTDSSPAWACNSSRRVPACRHRAHVRHSAVQYPVSFVGLSGGLANSQGRVCAPSRCATSFLELLPAAFGGLQSSALTTSRSPPELPALPAAAATAASYLPRVHVCLCVYLQSVSASIHPCSEWWREPGAAEASSRAACA